jgi:CRISPR type III-B/RAMP module-associated protein Cmr5
MSVENKRRSIEQKRAKYAWECAERSRKNKAVTEKYKSHVREFPMLVSTCGLVNAVAFAWEKRKDEGWNHLYKDLSNWLREHSGQKILVIPADDNGLMSALLVIRPDQIRTLRYMTNETIALFTWMKRFVSGDEQS